MSKDFEDNKDISLDELFDEADFPTDGGLEDIVDASAEMAKAVTEEVVSALEEAGVEGDVVVEAELEVECLEATPEAEVVETPSPEEILANERRNTFAACLETYGYLDAVNRDTKAEWQALLQDNVKRKEDTNVVKTLVDIEGNAIPDSIDLTKRGVLLTVQTLISMLEKGADGTYAVTVKALQAAGIVSDALSADAVFVVLDNGYDVVRDALSIAETEKDKFYFDEYALRFFSVE